MRIYQRVNNTVINQLANISQINRKLQAVRIVIMQLDVSFAVYSTLQSNTLSIYVYRGIE